LAAMAAEELLRANPVDGAVLLGGCDKTIPALLMAAASVDLPALVVPGGPMLTGHFRGAPLGCGTDVWRLGEEGRAGRLPRDTLLQSLRVPAGPMPPGHFRGPPLGCGTDVWRLGEEVRAGRLPRDTFLQSESAMIRSRGHCNTMGTRSPMACP